MSRLRFMVVGGDSSVSFGRKKENTEDGFSRVEDEAWKRLRVCWREVFG